MMRRIPNTSRGYSPGQCSFNHQQAAIQAGTGATWPITSAIQLLDANGCFRGWTKATAVRDNTTSVDVTSQLPYVFSLTTDLDANSLTFGYGDQGGTCTPSEWDQTFFRTSTCNFTCNDDEDED
jgi:hypothetical protein